MNANETGRLIDQALAEHAAGHAVTRIAPITLGILFSLLKIVASGVTVLSLIFWVRSYFVADNWRWTWGLVGQDRSDERYFGLRSEWGRLSTYIREDTYEDLERFAR